MKPSIIVPAAALLTCFVFIGLIAVFVGLKPVWLANSLPSRESQVAVAVLPVLATSNTFSILAQTSITNVATSSISGNVGMNNFSSNITGLTTGEVSGVINATDAIPVAPGAAVLPASVQADASAEFTTGIPSQPSDGSIGPALDSLVLNSGVYDIGAGRLNGGVLTLDGPGVYIFRASSDFISSGSINFTNGARPCDLFWRVETLATINGSTFAGTILAGTGVHFGANVTLDGRALAVGGDVTMISDTISGPSCPVPPPTATLRVIKLVINGSGGTGPGTLTPSDFSIHVKSATSSLDISGSPALGTSTPGTLYNVSPGTYTISEDANAAYIQSFSVVDCDSSGNVTLAAGENKICTIINTDIPPPVAVASSFSSSGSGGSSGSVPLIGILKIPTPSALSAGSGSVTYNYTVWNIAKQKPLVNVTVTDDKCGPVTRLSGDDNNDGKLDITENWKYSCTALLSTTTTNTSIATGYSDDALHQVAIATSIATVVVGAPAPGFPNTGLPSLINIIKVPSRLTPFPFGGGDVTYTYAVSNPGVVAMHDVTVIDDKCAPVYRVSGDLNGDNLLDPGESWVYTCLSNVPVSTRNVATARGEANGITSLGYAFATVLVAGPGFPNTGFPPDLTAPWNITIPVVVLILVSILLAVVLRKRPM